MPPALAQFQIKELAIHLVQQTLKASPTQAVLGEALTPMTSANQAFLKDRFRSTLKRSRHVLELQTEAGPVPPLLKGFFEGTMTLLETSRQLATQLQAVQKGISPSGLLLVASCDLNDVAAIVIAKLEHEKGARTRQTTTKDGKKIYDMEFLNDLFLTESSQVYKVALFPDPLGSESLAGYVIDRQTQGSSVADYFISTFLGCEFAVHADVLTEKFFEGAQKFLSNVTDAATRARYQAALLSELQSNTQDLSPETFARDHLDPVDFGDFSAALLSQGIALTDSFVKDVALVKQKLAAMQVVFQHGVVVTIPPDQLGDGGHAWIEPADGGQTRVEITDVVEDVGSKGSIKSTEASGDVEG